MRSEQEGYSQHVARPCRAGLEMFRALLKGRFQRLNWVPFRDELVRDVPGVPGLFDGA